MKSCGLKGFILAVLLLVAVIPLARAQNLMLGTPSRDVYQSFSSGDSLAGPYFNTFPGASTNGLGLFSVNQVDSTPGNQTFVSATADCVQNSTISNSATSLTVAGLLQFSASGSASQNESGDGGSADWFSYSRVQVPFTITQPFTYSLQATTTLLTNTVELSPSAFVGLRYLSTFIAAYGSSRSRIYTAPSTQGTTSGVLAAGQYELDAECITSGGITFNDSPTAENFVANFTLNVTAMPQPPVILSLAPNGPGTFFLVWNAYAAGNYRVQSSTNLVDWGEFVASGNYLAGVNSNIVNLVSGPSTAYFRIQYLP